jgi:hypothetical protein
MAKKIGKMPVKLQAAKPPVKKVKTTGQKMARVAKEAKPRKGKVTNVFKGVL